MSKKALIIPLSIIFVLTIGAFSAYAYGGAVGFNGADRQAVEEALTKGDYQAWQEAASNSPLTEKITEDNFVRFVQAHQLREQARQIEEDLGITDIGGRGGRGEGMCPNSQNHQAIMAALDSGNYQAWKEAVGDSPLAEKITEDNFGRFVQAHQLRQSGQFDEARQIEESLGIDFPGRRGQARQAK
ncbi:MAG TPA: hypothetical protein PK085_03605 [bacterium]|nr:hypothetical protein [bacterium]